LANRRNRHVSRIEASRRSIAARAPFVNGVPVLQGTAPAGYVVSRRRRPRFESEDLAV